MKEEKIIRIFYKNTKISPAFLQKKISTLISKRKENIVAFICSSSLDCLVAEAYRITTNRSIFIIPSYFSKNAISKLLSNVKPNTIHTMKEGSVNESFVDSNSNNSIELIDGSILFVTSSSIGEPKIVYKTNSQLNYEIKRYVNMYNITCEDTLFPIVPLFHNYGYVCGLLAAYYVDANLLIQDNLYPSRVLNLSNEHKASIWLSIPNFYKQLLLSSVRLNCKLKRAICSCACVDDKLLEDFQKKFGTTLTQQYGSTETGSLAISGKQDCANQFGLFMDEVRFDCHSNSSEVLVHSSETVGSYILNNQIISVPNNPYHTGDVGEIDKNKLLITGRLDDIINIAGKKISLSYLEKQILECGGIENVTIKCKYTQSSIYLICYFSSKLLTEENVRNFCNQKLPRYCLPQKYIKVTLSWKQHDFSDKITER